MSTPPPVIYVKIAQKPAAQELIEAGSLLVEKSEKYKTILSDGDASIVGELRARLKKHIDTVDNERLEMTEPARTITSDLNAEFKPYLEAMEAALKRIDAALKAYMDEQERKRKEAERLAREEQLRIENERRQKAREAEEAAEKERKRIIAEAQAAADAAADAAELEAAQLRRNQQLEALENQQVVEANQRNSEAIQQAQAVMVPAAPPANRVFGSYGSSVGKKVNWKWKVVDITLVPEEFLVPPEERVQKSTLNALAKSQKGNAKVAGIEFYTEDSIANFKVGS